MCVIFVVSVYNQLFLYFDEDGQYEVLLPVKQCLRLLALTLDMLYDN